LLGLGSLTASATCCGGICSCPCFPMRSVPTSFPLAASLLCLASRRALARLFGVYRRAAGSARGGSGADAHGLEVGPQPHPHRSRLRLFGALQVSDSPGEQERRRAAAGCAARSLPGLREADGNARASPCARPGVLAQRARVPRASGRLRCDGAAGGEHLKPVSTMWSPLALACSISSGLSTGSQQTFPLRPARHRLPGCENRQPDGVNLPTES
jgi:hypothetical protein